MNINWKVRMKNPVFWVAFIPSICAVIYTILSCLGVVPGISEETLVNVLLALVSALETLGVLVDPTTKGTSDSERAMSYDQPA